MKNLYFFTLTIYRILRYLFSKTKRYSILLFLILVNRPKSILEIGVYNGVRAREMIEADLPLCLATDYNSGSTPSGNIPFVLSLACLRMKLLPEEAINAVTMNGACAMELQNELGSITKGKRANLIITKPINSINNIPYSFGSNLIDQVIIDGDLTMG